MNQQLIILLGTLARTKGSSITGLVVLKSEYSSGTAGSLGSAALEGDTMTAALVATGRA